MKKYIVITIIVVLLLIGLPTALGYNHGAKKLQPATESTYIALGDSVAAGVGLKYDSDSSACNRTDQGYPALTAKKLQY